MAAESYASNVDILYSAETIASRVQALGEQITVDYAGRELVVVCVLRGAFVFMADLVRFIDLPMRCEFIAVSSYGDATESSGVVRLTQDLASPVAGRDVLIVEDIVDTGLSMSYMRRNIALRDPRSVAACTLLDKRICRKVDCAVEYVGFEIPDQFVVGYGLDAAQAYRNLPFVGVYNVPA